MDKDVFPVMNAFYSFGVNQRFLSGSIFVAILLILTACYFYFLRHVPKRIWLVIFVTTVLTFPAFPAAFSRDVYNYSMDAKNLMVYHQNPWTTPPKAHPSDPLLPHIHWPNDPTRYGPVWVLPTAAIYPLGQNQIGYSQYLFKFYTLLGWLGSLYLVGKVVKKLNGDPAKAIIFLAFNPLLIIEYFIGTHTDIVMTFFILLSLYLLFTKHQKLSWLSFVFSIGTKITSLPEIVPLWLARAFLLSPKVTIFLSIWFAYLGSLIIIAKWSINPWYFTLPVVLTGLYLQSKWHKWLAISLSLAAAIRYAPLLFLGPFDPHNKIRAILFLLLLVPFVIWTLRQGRASIRSQEVLLARKATFE